MPTNTRRQVGSLLPSRAMLSVAIAITLLTLAVPASGKKPVGSKSSGKGDVPRASRADSSAPHHQEQPSRASRTSTAAGDDTPSAATPSRPHEANAADDKDERPTPCGGDRPAGDGGQCSGSALPRGVDTAAAEDEEEHPMHDGSVLKKQQQPREVSPPGDDAAAPPASSGDRSQQQQNQQQPVRKFQSTQVNVEGALPPHIHAAVRRKMAGGIPPAGVDHYAAAEAAGDDGVGAMEAAAQSQPKPPQPQQTQQQQPLPLDGTIAPEVMLSHLAKLMKQAAEGGGASGIPPSAAGAADGGLPINGLPGGGVQPLAAATDNHIRGRPGSAPSGAVTVDSVVKSLPTSRSMEPLRVLIDGDVATPVSNSELYLRHEAAGKEEAADGGGGDDDGSPRITPTSADGGDGDGGAVRRRPDQRGPQDIDWDEFGGVLDATKVYEAQWRMPPDFHLKATDHAFFDTGRPSTVLLGTFRRWDAQHTYYLDALNQSGPDWWSAGRGPATRDIYPETMDDVLTPFGPAAGVIAEWLEDAPFAAAKTGEAGGSSDGYDEAPPAAETGDEFDLREKAAGDRAARLASMISNNPPGGKGAEKPRANVILAAVDCSALHPMQPPCHLGPASGTSSPGIVGLRKKDETAKMLLRTAVGLSSTGRDPGPGLKEPRTSREMAEFAAQLPLTSTIVQTWLQLRAWLGRHEEVAVFWTPDAAHLSAETKNLFAPAALAKIRSTAGIPVLFVDEAAVTQQSGDRGSSVFDMTALPRAFRLDASTPLAYLSAVAVPFGVDGGDGPLPAGFNALKDGCSASELRLAVYRKVAHAEVPTTGAMMEGNEAAYAAGRMPDVPTLPLHEIEVANRCFTAPPAAGAKASARAIAVATAWLQAVQHPYIDELRRPSALVTPLSQDLGDPSLAQTGQHLHPHGPPPDEVSVDLVLLSTGTQHHDPLLWLRPEEPCRALLRRASYAIRRRMQRDAQLHDDDAPLRFELGAYVFDPHMHPQAFEAMRMWTHSPKSDAAAAPPPPKESTSQAEGEAEEATPPPRCEYAISVTLDSPRDAASRASDMVRRQFVVTARSHHTVLAAVVDAMSFHRSWRRWRKARVIVPTMNSPGTEMEGDPKQEGNVLPRHETMWVALFDKLRGGSGPTAAAWSSINQALRRTGASHLFVILGSQEMCAACLALRQHVLPSLQAAQLRQPPIGARKVHVVPLSWTRDGPGTAPRSADLVGLSEEESTPATLTWRDHLIRELPLAGVPSIVAANETHIAIWQQSDVEVTSDVKDILAFAFAFGFHATGELPEDNVGETYHARRSRWRQALFKGKSKHGRSRP